ncbi:hypothetical protein JG688_00017505 [Phytophthora aleatoria]|uniref:Uncharacterized protein n=1 Tax=Phytophthora aleatoria TaxID=2496075 RepID=A0A8J5MC49_9STRA|nr:hypothetical protein JG688_00017505 [Phytophthora aleatoria]
MAYQHAQLAADKTRNNLERLSQKKTGEESALDQLRLAVEGGEYEMTAIEERQLRNVAGLGEKKPRLTNADHAVIVELAGTLSWKDIGARVGTSQRSVSLHHRDTSSSSKKAGRSTKLTQEMLYAAARSQFIFNTISLQRTCALSNYRTT